MSSVLVDLGLVLLVLNGRSTARRCGSGTRRKPLPSAFCKISMDQLCLESHPSPSSKSESQMMLLIVLDDQQVLSVSFS